MNMDRNTFIALLQSREHGMPTRIAVEVPGENADIALTDAASGS
jgi:hypothetical protein